MSDSVRSNGKKEYRNQCYCESLFSGVPLFTSCDVRVKSQIYKQINVLDLLLIHGGAIWPPFDK